MLPLQPTVYDSCTICRWQLLILNEEVNVYDMSGLRSLVNSLVVFYMWYYGDGHERAGNCVYELSEGCEPANFLNKNKVRKGKHHNSEEIRERFSFRLNKTKNIYEE